MSRSVHTSLRFSLLAIAGAFLLGVLADRILASTPALAQSPAPTQAVVCRYGFPNFSSMPKKGNTELETWLNEQHAAGRTNFEAFPIPGTGTAHSASSATYCAW